MRHDQHITHPMTDPQRKTKTMNMTMNKTRVQNCDVRAVSHSCDVFLLRHFKIINLSKHCKGDSLCCIRTIRVLKSGLIPYCSRNQVMYLSNLQILNGVFLETVSYGIVFVISSSHRLLMLSIPLATTGDLGLADRYCHHHHRHHHHHH